MNDNANASLRRRVFNIIWTAAEEHGFEPPFTAFFQDGSPDFYMNSIIGYVRKWYDPVVMERLFDRIKLSIFRETLDGLLWLALENCVYEKEVVFRPVLKELRIQHAEMFLAYEKNLSRQQWMAMNSSVHALQAAKCRELLGKEPGLVSPKEKRLYAELKFDGGMTAAEIEERALDIFQRYYRFSPSGKSGERLLSFLFRLRGRFSRPLPFKMIRKGSISVGRPDPDGPAGIYASASAASSRTQKSPPKESDRLYIESCFGRPLFQDEENERINGSLCVGSHQNCRLHFTDGSKSSYQPSDPLIKKALAEAAVQADRNRAYYNKRRLLYQRNIIRLAEQIRNSILVHSQPLPVLSRSGIFDPEHVWRAVKVSDPRVFMDVISEEQADFSVDLLLDASASRLEAQELIAAQAYIIASSLRLCGIPIQVSSFLSVRGFTVLRRFCGYKDLKQGRFSNDGLDRIFDYFAAGWNRDGLAFRGIDRLMTSSESKNHLLIVLTDASPNDDRKIPPQPSRGSLVGADYSGKAGVEDAAAEVRRLRESNVSVMAILNGKDDDTKSAREIYGNDFIRIESVSHLSSAAGSLIRSQIEKISNK